VWNWIQEQRQAPEQTTNSRTVADCISFMLLTGVRSGEAVNLKWDDLNLEDGYFELKDPKNKNPVTLPISSTLLEILNARPRINEYVFPGRSKNHLKDVRGMLEKVADTAGTRIRPHDLRRTFRAIAAAAGVEYWKTKLLMNHKPGADITLQAYTELNDLRYLKPDTEKITAWVLEQAAIAASPKVIPIDRKAKK
jgi:integrase